MSDDSERRRAARRALARFGLEDWCEAPSEGASQETGAEALLRRDREIKRVGRIYIGTKKGET